MLALGIFAVLLLVIAGVAIWYYYRWTPEGILRDVESNFSDTLTMREATIRAEKLRKRMADVEATDQKFNPVKKYKGK